MKLEQRPLFLPKKTHANRYTIGKHFTLSATHPVYLVRYILPLATLFVDLPAVSLQYFTFLELGLKLKSFLLVLSRVTKLIHGYLARFLFFSEAARLELLLCGH